MNLSPDAFFPLPKRLLAMWGLLLVVSACGKSGGEIPSARGLETPFSMFVQGTSGLPAMLADLSSAIDAIEARVPKDDLDQKTSRLSGLLLSEAGWRTLGLDPQGEVAMVFDQRLSMMGEGKPGDIGLASLLILKIDDRAKLVESLANSWIAVELGAEDHGVTPLLFKSKPIAYVAMMGERTVIAAAPNGAVMVKDGLRRFVAGGGDKLEGAATFRSTMKDGPGGAGVYVWLSDMNKVEQLLADMPMSPGHRRVVAGIASQFVSVVGLRMSQKGVALRLLPEPAMKDLIVKASSGTRSPRDLGTLLPPRGWAAIRMSIDPKDALPLIFSRMGDGLADARRRLGRLGISLDEVMSVLSGDVGAAADVQSAVLSMTMGGGLRYVLMVGISDRDKAAKLVESLVGVAMQMGSKTRRFEADGETAWELGTDRNEPGFIAVTNDMVVLAPSEDTLVDALKRRKGDNLSKTTEGTVLREQLAVASVADLAPLVALIEGDVGITSRPWRGEQAVALGSKAMAGWKAFRERPFFTAKLGVDEGVVFATIDDGGLLYGAALGGIAGLVVREKTIRH